MKKKFIKTKLPVFFFREDENTIIATCPILDISTCGDTLEEARSNFFEMLDLFIDEANRMGTLEKILIECGWKKEKDQYHAPVLIDSKLEEIKIPCLN